MIKFCVEKWDKNKEELEADILFNLEYYLECNYLELVQKVVHFIFNDGEESEIYTDKYNVEKITEIDNGDYQGTLLYLIPSDTYQPASYDYLLTYVEYGSCSGCDTLQNAQSGVRYGEGNVQEVVSDFMTLCLHLVQNTIKPYNTGWSHSEAFDVVKEE